MKLCVQMIIAAMFVLIGTANAYIYYEDFEENPQMYSESKNDIKWGGGAQYGPTPFEGSKYLGTLQDDSYRYNLTSKTWSQWIQLPNVNDLKLSLYLWRAVANNDFRIMITDSTTGIVDTLYHTNKNLTQWEQLNFSLDSHRGKTINYVFEYATDVSNYTMGVFVDEITIYQLHEYQITFSPSIHGGVAQGSPDSTEATLVMADSIMRIPLYAKPVAGSYFSHWRIDSGAVTLGNTTGLSVTIKASTNALITPVFMEIPRYRLRDGLDTFDLTNKVVPGIDNYEVWLKYTAKKVGDKFLKTNLYGSQYSVWHFQNIDRLDEQNGKSYDWATSIYFVSDSIGQVHTFKLKSTTLNGFNRPIAIDLLDAHEIIIHSPETIAINASDLTRKTIDTLYVSDNTPTTVRLGYDKIIELDTSFTSNGMATFTLDSITHTLAHLVATDDTEITLKASPKIHSLNTGKVQYNYEADAPFGKFFDGVYFSYTTVDTDTLFVALEEQSTTSAIILHSDSTFVDLKQNLLTNPYIPVDSIGQVLYFTIKGRYKSDFKFGFKRKQYFETDRRGDISRWLTGDPYFFDNDSIVLSSYPDQFYNFSHWEVLQGTPDIVETSAQHTIVKYSGAATVKAHHYQAPIRTIRNTVDSVTPAIVANHTTIYHSYTPTHAGMLAIHVEHTDGGLFTIRDYARNTRGAVVESVYSKSEYTYMVDINPAFVNQLHYLAIEQSGGNSLEYIIYTLKPHTLSINSNNALSMVPGDNYVISSIQRTLCAYPKLSNYITGWNVSSGSATLTPGETVFCTEVSNVTSDVVLSIVTDTVPHNPIGFTPSVYPVIDKSLQNDIYPGMMFSYTAHTEGGYAIEVAGQNGQHLNMRKNRIDSAAAPREFDRYQLSGTLSAGDTDVYSVHSYSGDSLDSFSIVAKPSLNLTKEGDGVLNFSPVTYHAVGSQVLLEAYPANGYYHDHWNVTRGSPGISDLTADSVNFTFNGFTDITAVYKKAVVHTLSNTVSSYNVTNDAAGRVFGNGMLFKYTQLHNEDVSIVFTGNKPLAKTVYFYRDDSTFTGYADNLKGEGTIVFSNLTLYDSLFFRVVTHNLADKNKTLEVQVLPNYFYVITQGANYTLPIPTAKSYAGDTLALIVNPDISWELDYWHNDSGTVHLIKPDSVNCPVLLNGNVKLTPVLKKAEYTELTATLIEYFIKDNAANKNTAHGIFFETAPLDTGLYKFTRNSDGTVPLIGFQLNAQNTDSVLLSMSYATINNKRVYTSEFHIDTPGTVLGFRVALSYSSQNDYEIEVAFEKKNLLTVDVSSPNGTVNQSPMWLAPSDTIELRALPDALYDIDLWEKRTPSIYIDSDTNQTIRVSISEPSTIKPHFKSFRKWGLHRGVNHITPITQSRQGEMAQGVFMKYGVTEDTEFRLKIEQNTGSYRYIRFYTDSTFTTRTSSLSFNDEYSHYFNKNGSEVSVGDTLYIYVSPASSTIPDSSSLYNFNITIDKKHVEWSTSIPGVSEFSDNNRGYCQPGDTLKNTISYTSNKETHNFNTIRWELSNNLTLLSDSSHSTIELLCNDTLDSYVHARFPIKNMVEITTGRQSIIWDSVATSNDQNFIMVKYVPQETGEYLFTIHQEKYFNQGISIYNDTILQNYDNYGLNRKSQNIESLTQNIPIYVRIYNIRNYGFGVNLDIDVNKLTQIPYQLTMSDAESVRTKPYAGTIKSNQYMDSVRAWVDPGYRFVHWETVVGDVTYGDSTQAVTPLTVSADSEIRPVVTRLDGIELTSTPETYSFTYDEFNTAGRLGQLWKYTPLDTGVYTFFSYNVKNHQRFYCGTDSTLSPRVSKNFGNGISFKVDSIGVPHYFILYPQSSTGNPDSIVVSVLKSHSVTIEPGLGLNLHYFDSVAVLGDTIQLTVEDEPGYYFAYWDLIDGLGTLLFPNNRTTQLIVNSDVTVRAVAHEVVPIQIASIDSLDLFANAQGQDASNGIWFTIAGFDSVDHQFELINGQKHRMHIQSYKDNYQLESIYECLDEKCIWTIPGDSSKNIYKIYTSSSIANDQGGIGIKIGTIPTVPTDTYFLSDTLQTFQLQSYTMYNFEYTPLLPGSQGVVFKSRDQNYTFNVRHLGTESLALDTIVTVTNYDNIFRYFSSNLKKPQTIEVVTGSSPVQLSVRSVYNPVEISVLPNDNGLSDPEHVIVSAGDSVYLTAFADSGYAFSYWENNEGQLYIIDPTERSLALVPHFDITFSQYFGLWEGEPDSTVSTRPGGGQGHTSSSISQNSSGNVNVSSVVQLSSSAQSPNIYSSIIQQSASGNGNVLLPHTSANEGKTAGGVVGVNDSTGDIGDRSDTAILSSTQIIPIAQSSSALSHTIAPILYESVTLQKMVLVSPGVNRIQIPLGVSVLMFYDLNGVEKAFIDVHGIQEYLLNTETVGVLLLQ
ncbi:MAG: hypothetical protein OCC49_03620 [Fibrobacterales bacterium]